MVATLKRLTKLTWLIWPNNRSPLIQSELIAKKDFHFHPNAGAKVHNPRAGWRTGKSKRIPPQAFRKDLSSGSLRDNHPGVLRHHFRMLSVPYRRFRQAASFCLAGFRTAAALMYDLH